MTFVAKGERRRRSLGELSSERYYRPGVSTLSVIVFLLLWEISAKRGWINPRFTSEPSEVFWAAVAIIPSGRFLHDASVSLTEFGLGFALTLIVGVPLGLLLGSSPRIRLFIEPPLMALYTAPRLALLPILIVWLGIGMASKVAVVFLGAVFPIIVNTTAGARESDPGLIQVARAFGANQIDIFIRILTPGALPAILMGVRLGIGRGVLSIVVGEMFASEAGIGHQIVSYGEVLQVSDLLVYALVVSVFGYALTTAVRLLENQVRSWKPER